MIAAVKLHVRRLYQTKYLVRIFVIVRLSVPAIKADKTSTFLKIFCGLRKKTGLSPVFFYGSSVINRKVMFFFLRFMLCRFYDLPPCFLIPHFFQFSPFHKIHNAFMCFKRYTTVSKAS